MHSVFPVGQKDLPSISFRVIRAFRGGMPGLLKLTALCLGLVGLGAAHAEEITVSGGKIDLQFTTPPPAALRPLVRRWVETAGHAVAIYYGRFPVDAVRLRVSPQSGHRISHGETFGWSGARIKISVGTATTAEEFSRDWMLTHEMLHLAFPSLPETHHWLEEGMATYVEPVARARAGYLSSEKVWGDLVESLPQGLPQAEDQGLDGTSSWGRTYWGGALFCLRADVEIRRRTQNRFGLEHALRAILAAGGDVRHDWSIDRVIATGDRATGVPVLRELYDEMSQKPVQVDLPALWQQLGIAHHGHVTTFDDRAPLASVRQAITAPTRTE